MVFEIFFFFSPVLKSPTLIGFIGVKKKMGQKSHTWAPLKYRLNLKKRIRIRIGIKKWMSDPGPDGSQNKEVDPQHWLTLRIITTQCFGPAWHLNRIRIFTLMRIRIRLFNADADPDPQQSEPSLLHWDGPVWASTARVTDHGDQKYFSMINDRKKRVKYKRVSIKTKGRFAGSKDGK